MPDVITNTSPLQYLYQVGHLQLLPALYGQVRVLEAVVQELGRGQAEGIALPDVTAFPWVRVQSVVVPAGLLLGTDLGDGEQAVLGLALAIPGALVVLDDAAARQEARRLGLSLTGTLGVLLKAKQAGHLARVEPVLEQLEACRFFLDAQTRATVLRLAGEAS
jgi:predicted nucleic acid-binding protein